MDVKEYLQQACLLDRRINFNLRRMQEMKSGLCGLSSPQMDAAKVQTSRNGDAPFVKALLRVEEMQERINRETDLLVELQQQISEVIHSLPSEKQQMVLLYRYVETRTWEEIGNLLGVGKSTAKRWHTEALTKLRLPENPIQIHDVW